MINDRLKVVKNGINHSFYMYIIKYNMKNKFVQKSMKSSIILTFSFFMLLNCKIK